MALPDFISTFEPESSSAMSRFPCFIRIDMQLASPLVGETGAERCAHGAEARDAGGSSAWRTPAAQSSSTSYAWRRSKHRRDLPWRRLSPRPARARVPRRGHTGVSRDRARAAVNFSGTIDFGSDRRPRGYLQRRHVPGSGSRRGNDGAEAENVTRLTRHSRRVGGRRPRRKTFLFLFSRRLSLRVCVRR